MERTELIAKAKAFIVEFKDEIRIKFSNGEDPYTSDSVHLHGDTVSINLYTRKEKVTGNINFETVEYELTQAEAKELTALAHEHAAMDKKFPKKEDETDRISANKKTEALGGLAQVMGILNDPEISSAVDEMLTLYMDKILTNKGYQKMIDHFATATANKFKSA